MTFMLTARVHPQELQALIALAERKSLSRSETLRRLIRSAATEVGVWPDDGQEGDGDGQPAAGRET